MPLAKPPSWTVKWRTKQKGVGSILTGKGSILESHLLLLALPLPCCGTLGRLLTLSGFRLPIHKMVVGGGGREVDRTVFLEVVGESFVHAPCITRDMRHLLRFMQVRGSVRSPVCCMLPCVCVCVCVCVCAPVYMHVYP